MRKVKTAVVGCGSISDIYLKNMMYKYSPLEIVACCAKHFENAEKKAVQYGIKACTYEEILADDTIEMVVILTPAPTHYELIKAALLSGKHVFTEKPMTILLEESEELLNLANEKKLYLGAAPETFLGSGFQTAKKAIDEGLIGEVTSFHIVANRDVEMLGSRFHTLRYPGGGICFDYGVYYLTALISLLGPVKEVFSVVKNHKIQRKNVWKESPEYGEDYEYDNESQVNAVLTLENNVTGTFSLNGDSFLWDLGDFTIHGTKGVLKLGDANQFGPSILYIPNTREDFKEEWQEILLDNVSSLYDNCRGIGPAQMAYAICKGEKHRASEALSYHVLDTVIQMMESGRDKKVKSVHSSCERLTYFNEWKELLK